jgi:hypothetical protein
MLLLAMIIGSIFSYLIVAGYYLNLDINVPENTTLSVVDVDLNIQNAETFNVTVLNPTYSPTEAKITEILVVTEDDEVHTVLTTNPGLPSKLGKGQEETFVCEWNWGDYAGETLKVVVMPEEGSGAVYAVETATVGLEITAAIFTTTDTQHFNVTVKNPAASESDLKVTKITVTMKNGTDVNMYDVAPTIPVTLLTGTSTTFVCTWDWTQYRGLNATVNVYTSQGYEFHRTETTPKAAQLTVTGTNFDATVLSKFSITVKNSENSIDDANITTVEVVFEDYTTEEASVESPSLPHTLSIGDEVTLDCLWDWSDHRGETVQIYVKTSEGYLGYTQKTLP